jgi:hypothetical protein
VDQDASLPYLRKFLAYRSSAYRTAWHVAKSPDRTAVPLCARHHRTGNDAYHKLGSRAFQIYHHVDLSSIVATLNHKPVIRIQGGTFVAYCGTEVYEAGSVGKGLRSAVTKAVAFAFEVITDAILDGAPGDGEHKLKNFVGDSTKSWGRTGLER